MIKTGVDINEFGRKQRVDDQVDPKETNDGSKKKERKLPRQRLLRKIQAFNESEQRLLEERLNAHRKPKNIKLSNLVKAVQKGPSLAEKIAKKVHQRTLRKEIYNHVEDLERKVDFLLQQLTGKQDLSEPYVDPEIWVTFQSEEFQQEIDKFLQSQNT